MKNILFVASECVPFIKTGGLADVAGALPKALDKSRYDVRVVLPRTIPASPKNTAASSSTWTAFRWSWAAWAASTWAS